MCIKFFDTHLFFMYILIKKMIKLPIYKAVIGDETDGVYLLSLVEQPAVESHLQCFDKDKPKMMFKAEDDEKRMAVGVIMCADRLIYRRTDEGYEYYLYFDKAVIEDMAQKMIKDGVTNTFTFHHNDEEGVTGIECRELFIKNTKRGINPTGFEDVEEGSLFGSFKINNEDVWEKVKDGSFGISLEGYFGYEQKMNKVINDEYDEIINLLEEYINKKKKK